MCGKTISVSSIKSLLLEIKLKDEAKEKYPSIYNYNLCRNNILNTADIIM